MTVEMGFVLYPSSMGGRKGQSHAGGLCDKENETRKEEVCLLHAHSAKTEGYAEKQPEVQLLQM